MKLTIYKKMMLGFMTVMAIMVLSSTYILFQLKTVSNAAEKTLTSNVQIIDLAKQLRVVLYDEKGLAEKFLISRDDTYFSLFLETSHRFNQYLDMLSRAETSGQENIPLRNMRVLHTSFVEAVKSRKESRILENRLPVEEVEGKNLEKLHRLLGHIVTANQASIRRALSRIKTTTGRSTKIALLLVSWSLLAAAGTAFIITRTITRPIGHLIKGTERIARGNFEPVKVTSKDEIALLAQAVNDMSRKIKETNRLRTQTLQQISHEFQNPLQAMLSACDLLQSQCSGALNEEQVAMMETIHRGIVKIEDLSRQYLDLAKIESGTMKYHLEPADLSQIVTPIVEDVKLIASRKDIHIRIETASCPNVLVDVEKISIVINNLLGNAIKYTQDGGKIIVKIGPSRLGAQVEIRDSGIGIAREELSKVFTRFYQANNVEKAKVQGTGVGLALVKAYTEGHGGRVYVESTVNKGSTFVVELPRT